MTITPGRTGDMSWTETSGDADRAVILLHSLGTDSTVWVRQIDEFARVRRVVAIDLPGHGRSRAEPGEYSIEDLGADVVAVADAAGLDRFDLCGISIGGLISLWLAVTAPERVSGLVASNTAARIGSAERWQQRIGAVTEVGLAALLPDVLPRWFSADFAARDPEALASVESSFASTDPAGYIGCCAALRDTDLRSEVTAIGCPSLVVGGAEDVSTPPSEAEWLHEQIDGSRLEIIPEAAHLANLDRPEAFAAAVLAAWDEWER